jgi:hypothetical protein
MPMSDPTRSATPDPETLTTALSFCKLCGLEDFEHPSLRPIIRDIFAHEIERFGPGFPRGRAYRKHWEVAMAVRAIRDAGLLHDRAEVLGVGAGNEPTIFWLTTKVRRVFATDLYLGPPSKGFSERVAEWSPGSRRWREIKRVRWAWVRHGLRKALADRNLMRVALNQEDGQSRRISRCSWIRGVTGRLPGTLVDSWSNI